MLEHQGAEQTYIVGLLPETIPIRSDTTKMMTKLSRMWKTVLADISVDESYFPNISRTDRNKIMATASLTMPSPKTIEKSLGNFLGFIMVRAATESVAQIVAE